MSKHAKGARKALTTPIVLHERGGAAWPEREPVFYLVAREGLFLCRNHPFFRSCVKKDDGPSELASAKPFFAPRFPRIPADVIEHAVGFFSRIADLHGSEAAALFAWDQARSRVELVVPPQTATMSRSYSGRAHPVGVHYDPPADLPREYVVFGDIHSHVDQAAYASHIDVRDELHSAGLHVVVGRIGREPPEIHVEAVVDGQRFLLVQEEVLEGYTRRCLDVPKAWIERVEVEVETYGGSYLGATVPLASSKWTR
jgi:hypothetical protein